MITLNDLGTAVVRLPVFMQAPDIRPSWAGSPFSSYMSARMAASREISSGLIVVSNPVAGNGRAAAYVKGLRSSIRRLEANGGTRILGNVELMTTDADREKRIESIRKNIEWQGVDAIPVVVAVGGDGTFADACEASLRARRRGIDSYVIPAPAGTACDMRRELGIPRKPEDLIDFIATAKRVELGAIIVRFGEGSERLLLHSAGFGVSGAVFDEVEAGRKRTGSASIASYLRGLVKGVVKTEPFLASLDDASPVEVGEVLVLSNSTSIGGVTRVPLPVMGGRLHLIPVDAKAPNLAGKIGHGVAALSDVFGRGVWFMLGDKAVIAPGEEIAVLAGRYTLDIQYGRIHDVRFFGMDGAPKAVPSIMNGDTIGSITGFTMEDAGDTILSLAAPDSDLMIRRGETKPESIATGARARFHSIGAVPAEPIETAEAAEGPFDAESTICPEDCGAGLFEQMPFAVPTALASVF